MDGVLARRQGDLTVVAENLHKPRNFSALVRTCDAVGIHEVHAVSGGAEVRRHWHTSQGAEKWVRVVTHASAAEACAALRERGFTLLAAHPSADAHDYREIDYTRPSALLVGTEAFGVTPEALRQADRLVRIPMMGMSQSLNVSVACAVLLYEALAQRRAAGFYDRPRLPPERLARDRFEWLYPRLARWCLEQGRDYPALDEDGELLSDPREP